MLAAALVETTIVEADLGAAPTRQAASRPARPAGRWGNAEDHLDPGDPVGVGLHHHRFPRRWERCADLGQPAGPGHVTSPVQAP